MATKPKDEIELVGVSPNKMLADALASYGVKSVKELTLLQKLAIIQSADLQVKKTGNNAFEKYIYKTFTDIKRAINPWLQPLHLAITSNILPESIETGETQKGKKTIGYLKNWRLYNVDDTTNKDFLEFTIPSYAVNTTMDKTFGTSITYSLKYFFNDTFLIPDESLDTDAQDNSEPQGKQVEMRNGNNEFQRYVVNEAKKNPVVQEKMKQYLKDNGLKNFSEINENQIREIMNLMKDVENKEETND